MHIVKSLHASLLHRTYQHFGKTYFTASVLWGFDLLTGEPVMEQDLWQAIGAAIGQGELFDAGFPKQNAEVVVSGSCFAPGTEPVPASRVRVSFGPIEKEILVYGDRHWIKGAGFGWGVTDPVPFNEMPITYKRAFGGEDHPPNPEGMGIAEVDIDGEPQIALPNLEYENHLIGSPNDRPPPASLGRVDVLAEQRLSRGGTYDQDYVEHRLPGFPDDFDYDFMNDGAPDQWQQGPFTGAEQYEILNMHPEHARISGRIPSIRGRCFVDQRVDGNQQFREIATELDTVWLFPGATLGVLIDRGTIEVYESNATDITRLLIANEGRQDAPREPAHYQLEMERRTDTAQAYKYLLNTSPLIPEGMTCGFQTLEENSDFPLEMIANQNLDNYAKAQQQEIEDSLDRQMTGMREQMIASGTDPAEVDELIRQLKGGEGSAELAPEFQQVQALLDRIAPRLPDDPNKVDLARIDFDAIEELKQLLDKIAADKQAEARDAILNQIEALKQQGEDTEALESQVAQAMAEMERPALLPRIDVDGILEQSRQQRQEVEKQLMVMQSMGLKTEEIAAFREKVDPDKIDEMARQGMEKALEGYRLSAHYIEKARSPHEGEEPAIRENLLNAYRSGARTAGGDYAFVDLSGLDLSGIDLSGSYLEFADLSDTNLTGANLSKAVLANAKLHNTRLDQANLTDANLGSVDFDGASLVDADLTGATLSRSSLRQSHFERCKMAEKQDMMLETVFEKSRFIDCDMRQLNYIDSDISHCVFSGSDLSKSSFVNPVMRGARFDGANLAGVSFIKADAVESVFDEAELKNTGFYDHSDLNGSSFLKAGVIESNLRECNLEKARFTESRITRSDFSGANLREADFTRANGFQAQFNQSDLTHASLERINLMEGSMTESILSGARLTDGNFYLVNFTGSTIGSTDFTGAYLAKTLFKDWRPT